MGTIGRRSSARRGTAYISEVSYRPPMGAPQPSLGRSGRSAELTRRHRTAVRWFCYGIVCAVVAVAANVAFGAVGTTVLFLGGAFAIFFLVGAAAQRSENRKYATERAELVAEAAAAPGQEAVLQLYWLSDDRVAVSWDGLEVGTWEPFAPDPGHNEQGPSWQLRQPEGSPERPAGERHFRMSGPNWSHVDLSGRRFLLTRNAVLTDDAGREWPVPALRPGEEYSAALPAEMGPDGAVFLLRSRMEITKMRARQASASSPN